MGDAEALLLFDSGGFKENGPDGKRSERSIFGENEGRGSNEGDNIVY